MSDLMEALIADAMRAHRQVISAATRAAFVERRDLGLRNGRPGVRDARPDLAERITAERASGATWQSIADRLNVENVPTIRGGTQWRVSSVQSAAGYVRPRPPI